MIDPLSQTINAPHKGQFIVMLVPNVIISLIRIKLLIQWMHCRLYALRFHVNGLLFTSNP